MSIIACTKPCFGSSGSKPVTLNEWTRSSSSGLSPNAFKSGCAVLNCHPISISPYKIDLAEGVQWVQTIARLTRSDLSA